MRSLVFDAIDSKRSSSISTLVIPNLKDPSGFKATGANAFPLEPKPIV